MKPPKADPKDATAHSNVKARKDAVTESLEELYSLDCKIAALVEKHIQPLRQAKNDIRKVLRDEYEVPGPVIAARYATYRIERQAEDEGDDSLRDAIKEIYEHLPIGGTVDLVEAAERAK